ncbi:MAG: hypothetical protein QM750_19705 [Rubrivivax sp.]
MTSPFEIHRDKVLGHYSTAAWLRNVVMALWNGTDRPVGLSKLSSLDDDHFRAFVEMLRHYRSVGENDLAFLRLVEDVRARLEDDKAAEDREMRHVAWRSDAARELRRLGKPTGLLDDRYNWFEARFDSGDSAAAAAAACEPLPALVER